MGAISDSTSRSATRGGASDASSSPEEPRPTRRLGEVLIDLGVLSPQQLENALVTQKIRGGRIGEVLLDLGMIGPIDLVRSLAEQFGLEFVDLDHVEIDRALAQRIPQPLARRHRAVPISENDGVALVAMANPADVIALDDVRSILRMPVRPVMADPGQIGELVSRSSTDDAQVQDAIRQAMADVGANEPDETQVSVQSESSLDDGPIVRFVDLMINRAVQERASDIHIEPTGNGLRVRYRVDGVLHEVMHPPKNLHAGIISRIKVLASIDIAEKRVPQDGRASISSGGRSIDLRVATVPTISGEAAVIRLLRRDDDLSRLEELGMEPSQFERFHASLTRTWGIVLVTGPTGSGKTTTLYSALRELNEPSVNILTVEDPVEYHLEGIKQMQVNPRAGLTFGVALRSLLRADPDILLVGEIRDRETAIIAVEASLTGHMVLASLHTNDSASTPLRLVEMGVEPYLVVAGLRGVLAQRLVRRLCDRCRTPAFLDGREALAAGIPPTMFNDDGRFHMHRAVGCAACSDTGYRGRFAVNEYLDVSEKIGQMILDGEPAVALNRQAQNEGMIGLRDSGLARVAAGDTTLEELIRCIS